MSTKIKPGAWTGWPPFEVSARLQDSEEDGPWPPGTRIVVVELTIGGVTAAQALATAYDEPGETADLLTAAVVDQLFEFMATHCRRLIVDAHREEIAALLRGDGWWTT